MLYITGSKEFQKQADDLCGHEEGYMNLFNDAKLVALNKRLSKSAHIFDRM